MLRYWLRLRLRIASPGWMMHAGRSPRRPTSAGITATQIEPVDQIDGIMDAIYYKSRPTGRS